MKRLTLQEQNKLFLQSMLQKKAIFGVPKGLTNEIIEKIPKEPFHSNTDTFCDIAAASPEFVISICNRLNSYNQETDFTNRVFAITQYASVANMIEQEVEKNGFKITVLIIKNILEEDLNMKFDVVVGNPPYQHPNLTGANAIPTTLYIDFVKKAISLSKTIIMVIPSSWLFKPSNQMKNLLQEGKKLQKVKFLKNDLFKISIEVCYVIINNNYVGPVSIEDKNNITSTVNFKKSSLVCKDSGALPIVEKVVLQERSSLSNLWVRGGATRTTKENYNAHDPVSLVLSVGGRKNITVDSLVESTGRGYTKVGLASVDGGTDTIGKLAVYDQNFVCGKSVVFLLVYSNIESHAHNLMALLKTKLYKFLIKQTKASATNSKFLFSNLPKLDLAITWTDEELYKHFNLTQEEIDYIENNVK